MDKKTWRLAVLVVWALAEVGYRAYVTHGSRFGGRPYWPYYAYHRNRAAIGRLYALTSNNRTSSAYLEVREGRLADSTGHLSPAARALVQQLARDIAPAGYFDFSVNPVPSPSGQLFVTGPCASPTECGCNDGLHPTERGGVLLKLSSSSDGRRHTPTELDYVRVGNAALEGALRKRPCYVPIASGEFLGAYGLPSTLPLPYSEYQRDMLLSKPLRAIGLL